MPNYVKNRITLCGKGAAKFCEKLEGENGEFDFNKLIPMPSSLDVECGSNTIKGLFIYASKQKDILIEAQNYIEEKCKNWSIEDFRLTEEEEKQLYDLGEQVYRNIVKYDYPTWYEWRNANWGTKWNAMNVSKEVVSEDNVIIEFETAWDYPMPIFKKISRKFMGYVNCEYAEEQMYLFVGSMDFFNGHLIGFNECEDNSEEARELYHNLWGDFEEEE